MTKAGSTSFGENREKSTARTGAPTSRVLPILPASATDTSISKALADRGIPKSVYDFIEYNLGKGAALVAILSGEMRHHDHIPGEACSCE